MMVWFLVGISLTVVAELQVNNFSFGFNVFSL